jgi:hypothetical protein
MKFIKYISTVIAGAILFVSCDMSTDTTPGTMQVMLTDAPGDYEAVFIDIQEVRVHISSDADDGESGWVTISDDPKRVDLLELTNGNMEFLGEADLQPGTYSQMRFVLGDDNELIKNGESIHLTTPSAQESGLKLNINAEIESGMTYTLLLDFDASRSIVEAGASGQYNLKPVIRTVNLAEAGAIGGDIDPAEALPWVYAIAGSDTLAGTRATEEGEFLMIGIPSGTYQVSVEPTHDDYNRTVLSDIEVTAPDTTFVGTIELNGGE